MKIDWSIPQVRAGFWGGIDKLIGPGATKAEKNLQLYVPFSSGFMMVLYAHYAQLGWTNVQLLIAGLLAVDIVGGIITNATSSAKRWFHREGQGFKQHLSFIVTHFVQLSLYSWAFLDFDAIWVAVIGGYMVLACIFIMQVTLYLQRPVALALYSLSLVIALYWDSAPQGLEWFVPLFYLKLLVSHILREEPYRPDHE
ncbi:hypothetical protein VISI1226_08794 [Vibrio sinaloensis DSM 21326]|uniref:Uncharacterized protein n=1 Tax=Vibrio sinaloensis DSM 21326 TaxID=945550 RepID=E8MC59_PHOS4|nr:hypothetical protein [Vibrio sinaloensis]EGA68364.1 hypothetical protein VISI1226_08794 [Vibrio sinaloensis DSM 21326]